MQEAQTLGDSETRLPEPDQAAPTSAAAGGRQGAREWSADHPVNIRLSIPLGFGRYYLTIVGGKERRAPERRAAERLKHPLLTIGNVIVFAVVLALGTATGFVVMRGIVWAAMSFLQQQGALIIQ